MRLGVHVSIAGGLDRAVERALALGCDGFQIFVTNPRSWSGTRPSREAIRDFRAAREASGLGPVVVHLSYLPNLASPYRNEWRKSVRAFLAQVEDAAALGADFFVLHPGSSRGGRRHKACPRVARALRRALRLVRKGPVLLLENTAGAGSQLGAPPEDLAAIAEATRAPERVAVCFDTAHALAAGTNLARPGAMRAVRERYNRLFGFPALRLIHLNDSKTACGSGRDRHEHIGKGHLGETAFRDILHTPGLRRVPYILETPVDAPGDDARNLARARELAE